MDSDQTAANGLFDGTEDRRRELLLDFEVQFRGQAKPRIEAFLATDRFDGTPAERTLLINDLIDLEMRLRREQGEQPEIAEDTARTAEILEQSAGNKTIGGWDDDAEDLGEQTALVLDRLPMDFGEYRLLRKLGEGGMGVVYEAEQRGMGNRRVAIKTIRAVGETDERVLARFRIEVEAVAQLEHRHIVPVYHFGQHAGVHYYVMKLIEGGNLRQLVKTLRNVIEDSSDSFEVGGSAAESGTRSQPTRPAFAERLRSRSHSRSGHSSGWSKAETLASEDMLQKIAQNGSTANPLFIQCFVRMALQVCSALQHVHERGLLHRDIKPANFLLDRDGDAWLTDFGLAKIGDQTAHSMPGGVMGTYAYMSPEQAMGSQRAFVDHRTDIYSLGVTLYELLTLRRAVQGDSIETLLHAVRFEYPEPICQIDPKLPKDLETIIMKAMSKDPNARFHCAEDMALELQLFQQGKPLTIRPPSLVERLGYWARANRGVVASMMVIATVLFLAAMVSVGILLRANGEIAKAFESEKEQKQIVVQQRDKVERLLVQSDGMRVAAQSVLQQQEDPELALLLAIEAAKLHPGIEANSALLQAAELAHELRRFKTHSTAVGHLSFNHAANRLVTAVQMKPANVKQPPEPAIVWDPSTGQQLGKLNGARTITSTAFNPDDDLVLTASVNGLATPLFTKVDADSIAQATLWDARRFEPLVTFPGSRLRVAKPSAFHPEAEQIVLPATGNDAIVYGFDGQKLQTLSGHQQPVIHASYSGNGRRILTCSSDRQVRVWDAESGQELAVLSESKVGGGKVLVDGGAAVEISDNGQYVLVFSGDGRGSVWDLFDPAGPQKRTLTGYRAAQFIGPGDELLAHGLFSVAGATAVALAPLGALDQAKNLPVSSGVLNLTVGSNGKFVVLQGSRDRTELELWDLENRRLQRTFRHDSVIHSVVLSPDQRWIVAAVGKGDVAIWSTHDAMSQVAFQHRSASKASFISTQFQGSQLGLISNRGHAFQLRIDGDSLADRQRWTGEVLAPDTSHLLQRLDHELSLVPLAGGRIKRARVGPRDRALAIGPEGKLVALKQDGQRIMVWDSESDTRRFYDVEETGEVWAVFSADTNQLLVVCHSGSVQLWDLKTATITKQLRLAGRLQRVRQSCALSQFAVELDNGEVCVIDARTPELVTKVAEPGKKTRGLWFGPRGDQLIISLSGDEGRIEVWDLITKQRINQRSVPRVSAVAPHPYEPEILIGSLTNGALLWNYQADAVRTITSQPQRSACYSVTGEQFFLGSICPSETDPAFAELPEALRRRITQPDATEISRWDRATLMQDQSRSFPGAILTGQMKATTDGSLLVSMSSNGIVVTDANELSAQKLCQGHAQQITAALFDREAHSVLTTGRDGRICRWECQSGRLLQAWYHSRSIGCAALKPDGSLLANGDDEGAVTVWQIQTPAAEEPRSREVCWFEAPVRSVALSDDGSSLIAIDDAGVWQLIDLATGNQANVSDISEAVQWAEFSADGKHLLVLTKSRATVCVLEVATAFGNNSPRFKVVHQGKLIVDAQFDATGQRIAILEQSVDGGGLTLWGKELAGHTVFLKHGFDAGTKSSVQFDASGQFLIAAGAKGYSVLRIDTGERWLEGEGRLYRFDRAHQAEPFTQGKLDWLIRRNSQAKTATLVPIDPLEFAKTIVVPALSYEDKQQYLIGEHSVAKRATGLGSQVRIEGRTLTQE